MSGRGFGKTQAGEEWFYKRGVDGGLGRKMLLAGRTPADIRDYTLNGPGGLLTWHPELDYQPGNRRIVWPGGAEAYIRSGANPEQFRNFSGDTVWIEELAAWKYPKKSWDNLMFGLREADPRILVTSTPKPIKLIRELIERDDIAIVTGSTYENRENLSDRYIESVIKRYEGTALGRQEIYGEILDAVEGALWHRDAIEDLRTDAPPEMERIVIAVDPAVTAEEGSDETGIIVCGKGEDSKGYVIEDISGRYSPDEWARRVANAYRVHQANSVIAEVNNGGDLVETNILSMDESIPVTQVRAARGKHTRAEPVAALYEQKRVLHVGTFPELEDEQCTWVHGDPSPSRLDALVWGMTEVILEGLPAMVF